MKDDFDDILIHPRRGKNEKDLPGRALLVANPSEARLALELFRSYDYEQRFLNNATLLVSKNMQVCIAGPSLGAPAASLVMEKLIALGVKSFTLFSCCGAVDCSYHIGDVVIATAGISGEGVSVYYGGTELTMVSEKQTECLRKFLQRNDYVWKEGPVWSTDAPYREKRSELTRLHAKYGVVGVDMEFSALCSVATFRGVDLCALFVVSDELWGEQWSPGFNRPAYKHRCNTLIEQLIADQIMDTKDHGKNI
jgi:uridine phosphorylase